MADNIKCWRCGYNESQHIEVDGLIEETDEVFKKRKGYKFPLVIKYKNGKLRYHHFFPRIKEIRASEEIKEDDGSPCNWGL